MRCSLWFTRKRNKYSIGSAKSAISIQHIVQYITLVTLILRKLQTSPDLRSSCFCIGDGDREEFELERDRLIEELCEDGGEEKQVVKCPKQTLAFQLKPKMVVLRVSMHCHGCAKRVQKHIAKMEGVTSYEVDMERKLVVVFGDIVPHEVLESVSKVKNAEYWSSTKS